VTLHQKACNVILSPNILPDYIHYRSTNPNITVYLRAKTSCFLVRNVTGRDFGLDASYPSFSQVNQEITGTALAYAILFSP